MLIRDAWAESIAQTSDVATTAAQGGMMAQIAPLVLIFAVFYFLLIRPQQKKMKAHLDMVSALRRGDKIVTSGGIIGTITRIVDDKEAIVEIASGVEVRIMRSTIADVVSKSAVSAADAKEAA